MMAMQRTIKYGADWVKGFGEVMNVPGCEQFGGSPMGLTRPTRGGRANSMIRGNR